MSHQADVEDSVLQLIKGTLQGSSVFLSCNFLFLPGCFSDHIPLGETAGAKICKQGLVALSHKSTMLRGLRENTEGFREGWNWGVRHRAKVWFYC